MWRPLGLRACIFSPTPSTIPSIYSIPACMVTTSNKQESAGSILEASTNLPAKKNHCFGVVVSIKSRRTSERQTWLSSSGTYEIYWFLLEEVYCSAHRYTCLPRASENIACNSLSTIACHKMRYFFLFRKSCNYKKIIVHISFKWIDLLFRWRWCAPCYGLTPFAHANQYKVTILSGNGKIKR